MATTKLPQQLLQVSQPLCFIGRDDNGDTQQISIADILASTVNIPLLFSDGSTTFGVNPGSKTNPLNGRDVVFNTLLEKTLSPFTIGDGGGALDAGIIANDTWYYVFAIINDNTDEIDVIISTSKISPTLPADWSLEIYLGAIKTSSIGEVIPFIQSDTQFYWNTMSLDYVFSGGIGTFTPLYNLNVPPVGNIEATTSVTIRTTTVSGGVSSIMQSTDTEPVGARLAYFYGPGNAASIRIIKTIALIDGNQVRLNYNTGSAHVVTSYTLGWKDGDI